MAHHKSALKRIRQIAKRRLHNRYYKATTKNAIKKLRTQNDHAEALGLLPNVVSLIDRLAKRHIIHKNKASNLKSKLTKHVNHLVK